MGSELGRGAREVKPRVAKLWGENIMDKITKGGKPKGAKVWEEKCSIRANIGVEAQGQGRTLGLQATGVSSPLVEVLGLA